MHNHRQRHMPVELPMPESMCSQTGYEPSNHVFWPRDPMLNEAVPVLCHKEAEGRCVSSLPICV